MERIETMQAQFDDLRRPAPLAELLVASLRREDAPADLVVAAERLQERVRTEYPTKP